MVNNLHSPSGGGSGALPTGNPNRKGSVFDSPQEPKRRKTQKMQPQKRLVLPGPSEQGPGDKTIDLTNDDGEPVSLSSTAADDSEDSLNLGAGERSRTRIVSDGRATRSLRADRAGGEPSRTVGAGTEIVEPIDEFPVHGGEAGRVRRIRWKFENKSYPPKLQLHQSNPLGSLQPANYRSRVRLFIGE